MPQHPVVLYRLQLIVISQGQNPITNIPSWFKNKFLRCPCGDQFTVIISVKPNEKRSCSANTGYCRSQLTHYIAQCLWVSHCHDKLLSVQLSLVALDKGKSGKVVRKDIEKYSSPVLNNFPLLSYLETLDSINIPSSLIDC